MVTKWPLKASLTANDPSLFLSTVKLRLKVSFAHVLPQVPESGDALSKGPKCWESPCPCGPPLPPSSAAAASGKRAIDAATSGKTSQRFT